MATPTLTPDVEAPTETAPAAAKGPLAAILNGVEPARPVQPIGSTATLAEESASTSSEKPSKTSGRNGAQQEGHWAALVRAVAARIGRGGNVNSVKRVHTITESRMTGNQVNTANRIGRDTRHSGLNHRDAKVNDNNSKIRQQSGRDHRDAKTSDTRTGSQTGASKTGRDVKDHRDAKTSGATTNKQDVVHQTGRDGLDGKPGKTGDIKADPKAPKPTDGKSTDVKPDPKGTPAKADDTAKAKQGDKPTGAKPSADDKAPATDKTPEPTPRPRTQSSRETGYQDGTAAAKVAGHVKAYRDGAKDGWADQTAADDADRKRMDDAKARNATKPTPPAKPKMKPVQASTVDLAKQEQQTMPAVARPAEPVELNGLSANNVLFFADGASHEMSRGEVRTLKGFERRIAAKASVLRQVAEGSKTARTRAADHATRAMRLAEAAKTVQGGGRLVAKLQRLAESTAALQARTEQTEKRARRGAEAVTVLVANANTRHGGIYKAVADSPLTSPAEREFYQDKEGN